MGEIKLTGNVANHLEVVLVLAAEDGNVDLGVGVLLGVDCPLDILSSADLDLGVLFGRVDGVELGDVCDGGGDHAQEGGGGNVEAHVGLYCIDVVE